MKKVKFEHIPSIPVGMLTTLEPDDLSRLLAQADANLLKAKNIKSFIESAIALKYEDKAKHARELACKETGTVHFYDGDFRITSEIKKKVYWSQLALGRAVRYLEEKKEDPTDYVDITYNIPESKFKTFPDNMQEFFAAARTLSGGKQTFKIELQKGVLK